VYRLARREGLSGWVHNGEHGVDVYVEGPPEALTRFVEAVSNQPPPASTVTAVEVTPAEPRGLRDFVIRESSRDTHPTVRISPDLPVCEACLRELNDPGNLRFAYPYINCTGCGPRYSIILTLPYDRERTTMRDWPMCPKCAQEYHDPADRRFHAQPVACPACGPRYALHRGNGSAATGEAAIRETVRLLCDGAIVAVKGIGGYHLACDAANPAAVQELRGRKYRKEKPFAVMVATLDAASRLVDLTEDSTALLRSSARPIVLCPVRRSGGLAAPALAGVAPDNSDLGLMLPYAPLHALLFDAGAPPALVLTSGNRSSEPIAYTDDDALRRLSGIADAFLVGERPIARRVDDSVAAVGPFGPVVLRRSRGYAPDAVATLPARRPILAVGADLKNAITLVVDGRAFVSQHIGDLDQHAAREAFRETVRDLCRMYEVPFEDLLIAHDLHPEYASTAEAQALPGDKRAVQHHEAHIASVLAEREAWDARVVGIAFDGTGYGRDGTIWGGEVFAGGIREGFTRIAHLREAALPGGDAASRFPPQAAAGFLAQVDRESLPDLGEPPFEFPLRYRQAAALARAEVRTFRTTSMGRLFDTAAALLGFTRELSFEGQAAIWLEHLARPVCTAPVYPFPFIHGAWDFRPLLGAIVRDCVARRDRAEIARAFHHAVARGVVEALPGFCEAQHPEAIILSGGVFQNMLLLRLIKDLWEARRTAVPLWVNHRVPPNDGGISLGQALIAASCGGD
jgi:hydrogenase maturation protein HypF